MSMKEIHMKRRRVKMHELAASVMPVAMYEAFSAIGFELQLLTLATVAARTGDRTVSDFIAQTHRLWKESNNV
jgi:hypothetical protein